MSLSNQKNLILKTSFLKKKKDDKIINKILIFIIILPAIKLTGIKHKKKVRKFFTFSELSDNKIICSNKM